MKTRKTVGIISEYNPFHEGHRYHLKESARIAGSTSCRGIGSKENEARSRSAEAVRTVVVMSGDFTQRGEPAIYDKWQRADMAVKGGADLVLELPFIYACNGAEYFAHGGVGLLEALGICDFIAFGCEAGTAAAAGCLPHEEESAAVISRGCGAAPVEKADKAPADDCREGIIKTAGGQLTAAAEVLAFEPPDFKRALTERLESGLSYAKARAEAAALVSGVDSSVISSPNNMLGIEYIRQLKLMGSDMQPIAVKRRGAGHDQLSSENLTENVREYQMASCARSMDSIQNSQHASILSGAEIRARLLAENPELPSMESLRDALFARLVTMTGDEIDRHVGGGEGLGNRILKELFSSGFGSAQHCASVACPEREGVCSSTGVCSVEELISRCTTRRYTAARIRRLLTAVLLGFRKDIMEQTLQEPFYARVLAFNERGRQLLREIKKGGCPVITNVNRAEVQGHMLEMDLRAADMYNVITGRSLYEHSDRVQKPGCFV